VQSAGCILRQAQDKESREKEWFLKSGFFHHRGHRGNGERLKSEGEAQFL
jgi:hypothetical protein